MRADEARLVTWLGVELADRELYARYRAAMAPLLAAHGGRFDHDFEIARVLRSTAGGHLDRVFAISFPDRDARTSPTRATAESARSCSRRPSRATRRSRRALRQAGRIPDAARAALPAALRGW